VEGAPLAGLFLLSLGTAAAWAAARGKLAAVPAGILVTAALGVPLALIPLQQAPVAVVVVALLAIMTLTARRMTNGQHLEAAAA
jgi:hypothetical protein